MSAGEVLDVCGGDVSIWSEPDIPIMRELVEPSADSVGLNGYHAEEPANMSRRLATEIS